METQKSVLEPEGSADIVILGSVPQASAPPDYMPREAGRAGPREGRFSWCHEPKSRKENPFSSHLHSRWTTLHYPQVKMECVLFAEISGRYVAAGTSSFAFSLCA
jgi:hypothetical protein